MSGPSQCEQAFRQCYSRLREGGYLVVGWDEVPERTPVLISAVRSLGALQKFEFPPLGGWHYVTDTEYQHTYDFYRRPALKY